MTYLQSLQYLESFINYEKFSFWPYKKSLKLKRFSDFLILIGNPEKDLRFVHIAGTKGKGSTCAFVAHILREAGYKTGLYTSPHLLDFRERIRILEPFCHSEPSQNGEAKNLYGTQILRSAFGLPQNDRKGILQDSSDFEGMISARDFTRIVFALKPQVEKYNRVSKYGPLSFFEICTAVAFIYYKEKKADYVVLETGLGGRLDATNVVNPLVCAITPISLEHTQYLGDTLVKIAGEKAGIIKSHKSQVVSHQIGLVFDREPIVISAPQEREAREVIRNRCKKVGARLYEVGKDIAVNQSGSGFEVKGNFGIYRNLKIRLIGRHQIINAAVSVGIIGALRGRGVKIGLGAVKRGLYGASWPGRCEIVNKNPYIILDGAQNSASSWTLRESIKGNFKYKKLILILGICGDKDIKGVCKELLPIADVLILTQADNPRAAGADLIEKVISGLMMPFEKQVIKTKNVKEAKRMALGLADKKDLILVAGSLFVVGEFRKTRLFPSPCGRG